MSLTNTEKYDGNVDVVEKFRKLVDREGREATQIAREYFRQLTETQKQLIREQASTHLKSLSYVSM